MHLNALSQKRVYLKKSPIWQLYRLNMKQNCMRTAIEKINPAFLINSKLLSAFLIDNYSTKGNQQGQSMFNQLNLFIQKKIQEETIRVDYNILRLIAFFGFQDSLKKYQYVDQDKKLTFRLSSYQKAYLEKLSKVQSLQNIHQQYQTRVIQFLEKYQQELKNDCFDQLDDLIVAKIPNSQTKIYKIVRIRQFYWEQDQSNIYSIIDFVYQQVINLKWRNIQTLSVVIARLSSSKANNKYKMLEYLDQMMSKQQRPFTSKRSFNKNDFQDQQYQAFLWIAILTLKSLVNQIKPSQTVSQKVSNAAKKKFMRILKSFQIRQKKYILEIIALLSIIKNAFKQIDTQSSIQSITINSLMQLNSLSQSYSNYNKQMEYFISCYEANIKNIIFNAKNLKLLEIFIDQTVKLDLMFQQNIIIDSSFLTQLLNSEFQKILNSKSLILYSKPQQKALLKTACMLKDKKMLKQITKKVQLSATDTQMLKKNANFCQEISRV